FNQAAKLLAPGGIIYVNFVVAGDWLWERHGKALTHATNAVPIGYRLTGGAGGGTLISGPGISSTNLPAVLKGIILTPVDPNAPTVVSTDDWPFLFLPRREVPLLYVMPLLLIILISGVPVAVEFGRGKREILNWQMFFLGMAFMLLEVRAMADLSLLF